MNWYLVAIAVGVVVIGWLALIALRSSKGSLVGVWQGKKDGAVITIQFEGEASGGPYRQLTVQGEQRAREFGHWTVQKLTELHFIVMATDVKNHPRFGIDTKHYVVWVAADHVLLDGPDRPRWELKRSTGAIDQSFLEVFKS